MELEVPHGRCGSDRRRQPCRTRLISAEGEPLPRALYADHVRAVHLDRLASLLERGPDGSFAEVDPDVRAAAAAAVGRIDNWRSVYSAVETMFFGLSLGSVLVLVAIGLAITFGVMGVINMAHGERMMLGAYTTYVVQLAMPNAIGASILVAVPAAFLVAGLAGVLLERTIIRAPVDGTVILRKVRSQGAPAI